jgi:hypothetical protein
VLAVDRVADGVAVAGAVAREAVQTHSTEAPRRKGDDGVQPCRRLASSAHAQHSLVDSLTRHADGEDGARPAADRAHAVLVAHVLEVTAAADEGAKRTACGGAVERTRPLRAGVGVAC